MRIAKIDNDMRIRFRDIIFLNECGGKKSFVYKFSDPDGVRTGKSGWSFGLSQFDIANNPNAILALRLMGFTTDEIKGLRDQTITDMKPMDMKLKHSLAIVDQWDEQQLWECLTHSRDLCNELKIELSCTETLMHIADYHNQFYFSRGGKLWSWLDRGSRAIPVTPEMIRDFKYTTAWGLKQKEKPRGKDDVYRRYANIVKIMRGE